MTGLRAAMVKKIWLSRLRDVPSDVWQKERRWSQCSAAQWNTMATIFLRLDQVRLLQPKFFQNIAKHIGSKLGDVRHIFMTGWAGPRRSTRLIVPTLRENILEATPTGSLWPPSSIHKMTGLDGKMVWAVTLAHRSHLAAAMKWCVKSRLYYSATATKSKIFAPFF